MADSWQRGLQRPEKYDVVPVVDLQVGESDNTLWAVTRYPNGCYSPLNNFKEVDGKILTLYNVATYPEGAACSRVVEYNDVSFSLNDLSPGDYTIVDGEDGAVIADLEKTVSTARIKSKLE